MWATENARIADLPRDLSEIDPRNWQALEDWATRFLREHRNERSQLPELGQAIIRELKGGKLSGFELAKALRVSLGAIAKELGHLEEKGHVSKQGGRYKLLPIVRDPFPFLTEAELLSAKRKEVYVAVGIPDPSVESGIYNRTHPEGRKVNTPHSRSLGAGFYR